MAQQTRRLIEYADRGSRDFHPDDISLYFDSMSKIFEDFGYFDVDTFATASNTKGKGFFSRMDVPGSAGVNFFQQMWKNLLFVQTSSVCFAASMLLKHTSVSRLLAC